MSTPGPDLLDEARIRAASRSDLPAGFAFRHFQVIDSTNLEARRAAERGAPAYTVFVAESQTAGRGREGRQWYSPAAGGIYCSILLRPMLTPLQALVFTRTAALAAYDTLRPLVEGGPQGAPVPGLRIKPPNDLYLAGRKVCGILVESASMRDELQFLIVGMGINVNQERFPPDLEATATSLRLACGRSFDRASVLAQLLALFYQSCERLEREGSDSWVQAQWRSLTGEVPA